MCALLLLLLLCWLHFICKWHNFVSTYLICSAENAYTCNSEIRALDFHFNVVKSVVMCTGPCWNCYCDEFNLDSSILKLSKYLGIYIKASSKFLCCYDHLKLRFCSSLMLFVTEVNLHIQNSCLFSYWILLACYIGSGMTKPQKSVLTMLNNLVNRAAYKILKYLIKTLFVISDNVICHIRQYLGLHDIDVLCKERHERFLRTGLLRHAVLRSLTAQ